ncbi:cell division protein SepF [Streptococcus sp. DD12]|uniref:cell division protein SepF n=1 Tax=Streptococcus sp. DD12 TaxID=1777880 RepID=UPI0007954F93|nr:cell division protein SepF [Streptococcus sp. DD12]KXT75755.1 FtsZ-interacting protein [Streptococcus sp. DD12]
MAFKDLFEKTANYFSTDDIDEYDEEYEAYEEAPAQASQAVEQPQEPAVKSLREVRGAQDMSNTTTRPTQQETYTHSTRVQAHQGRSAYSEPVVSGNLAARRQVQATQETGRATIALKYPKKYTDAEEIVDLLIANECVLIDFQYMMDAQARRCLDFIDGASKVLAGNLKKVGASMYLLTPVDVVVDIEEMSKVTANQSHDFDFDLKSR